MKTIFVFDKRGSRAPMVWPFYNYLRHEYNIAFIDDVDQPAERSIKAMSALGGGLTADFILWGMFPGKALQESRSFLNAINIPIIVTIGDVWQFIERPGMYKHLWYIDNIKYILYKQRKTFREDPHLYRLWQFMENGIKQMDEDPIYPFKNADVIHSPWGVNPEKFPIPIHEEKDIDICHVCWTRDMDKNHHYRRRIRGTIENMKSEFNVWTKEVFRDDYQSILRRSKILIVDASQSGLTTQKYLEGAMNGCLLIGDLPHLDPEVFEDGKTMIRAIGSDDIERTVRYFLSNEDKRVKIAEALRLKVQDHYNLDASIDPLVEALQ